QLPLVRRHSRNREKRSISDEEIRVMIVTKKAISRRTVLRGMGVTLALPLLDGMFPAFATAKPLSGAVRRLAVVYVPNGIVMQNWTPVEEGVDFTMTPTLAPL